MNRRNWLREAIKIVDLTENVLAHPVAKLAWVLANIFLAAEVVKWLAELMPHSHLTPYPAPYKIVAIGLFVAFTYPLVLRGLMAFTSRRVSSGSKRSIITYAPGGWLVALLRFLFTKRAFDHIFSQIVIDGREEYFEALSRGDKWLARWRRVQLYLSLGIAAVSWIGVSALKKVIKMMWRAG